MLSYSEARQRAYFKCARELRAVACSVLDDTVNAAEFTGRTASWAKELAAKTAGEANRLEELGHEQTYATPGVQVANRKSMNAYHKSINAFEARWEAVRDV